MALTKISRSLLDTGISDSSDATAVTITSDEDFLVRQTSADVYDTNSGSSVRQFWGNQFSASNNTNTRVIIGSASNKGLVGGATVNSGGTKPIVNSYMAFESVDQTAGGEDGIIAFYTSSGGGSGTEKMRIDSSGNVGIGTSSPNSYTNYTTLTIDSPSSGTGSILDLEYRTDRSLSIFSEGEVSSIREVRNYPLGLGTNNTERMRIEADGGVAIGGTTAVYTLEVHGTSIFAASYSKGSVMPFTDNTYDLGHSSYRWDDVYATNGTIQTSDQNKKNTITNSDLGLDFINRLSPKSYKLNGGTRTHYGLIAQDVETVLSDISKPTADFAGFIKMIPEEEAPKHEENPNTETTYGLRYGEFIAPMIKAIQEQQAQIEALQSEINTLKGE